MSDLAQNSPPKQKIPTLIIIKEDNEKYIYILEKKRTPPDKKLTHIVYLLC